MSVDFSVSHCLYTISMYTFTAGPKVPLLTVSKDKVRADRHRIREQEREAQSLERECKSRSYHDESSIISAEQGMLVLDSQEWISISQYLCLGGGQQNRVHMSTSGPSWYSKVPKIPVPMFANTKQIPLFPGVDDPRSFDVLLFPSIFKCQCFPVITSPAIIFPRCRNSNNTNTYPWI